MIVCGDKYGWSYNEVYDNGKIKMLQVMLNVPKKGSVITWDFDILKGDVTFTVFRCRQSLAATPVHQVCIFRASLL